MAFESPDAGLFRACHEAPDLVGRCFFKLCAEDDDCVRVVEVVFKVGALRNIVDPLGVDDRHGD